jgi:hypothetical protein
MRRGFLLPEPRLMERSYWMWARLPLTLAVATEEAFRQQRIHKGILSLPFHIREPSMLTLLNKDTVSTCLNPSIGLIVAHPIRIDLTYSLYGSSNEH